MVENLCGYAQWDLAALLESDDIEAANRQAVLWCLEVNANQHSEICSVPQVRLEEERKVPRALPSLRPPLRRGELRKVDKMQTVRFGSARYSVPTAYVGHQVEVNVGQSEVVVTAGEREVARHPLSAPGGASILDEHYGGSRARPSRPVRVRIAVEREFMELGPGAEAFLRAAALSWSCPRCRSGPSRPTRWGHSGDRRQRARPRPGPGPGPSPAQAGPHPANRARGLPGSQDPALGARGAVADAGRSRDCRPRRVSCSRNSLRNSSAPAAGGLRP